MPAKAQGRNGRQLGPRGGRSARNAPKRGHGGRPVRFVQPAIPRVIRQRPKGPAGLGPHHFNAFDSSRPQALAFSVGPATHLSGAIRHPLATTTTGSSYILAAVSAGDGVNQMRTMLFNGSTWSLGETVLIATTGITDTPSASSPDTVMATRCSLRLRNVTAAGQVAGVVHFMRVSTGIAWGTAAAPDLVMMMLGSERTRSYSASELTATHQWDGIPVSQDKYHAFVAPSGFDASVADPGISTLLVLFEGGTTDIQKYETTVAAQYYARYRLAGPLSNMSKLPPTTSLDNINKLRSYAEGVGSAGVNIAQFLETVPKAAGFLKNLLNAGSPFIPLMK